MVINWHIIVSLNFVCFVFYLKRDFKTSLRTEPDQRIKIVEPVDVESLWENWLKGMKAQFPWFVQL